VAPKNLGRQDSRASKSSFTSGRAGSVPRIASVRRKPGQRLSRADNLRHTTATQTPSQSRRFTSGWAGSAPLSASAKPG